MRRRVLAVAAGVIGSAVSASVLRAAPVDDAKALLAKKQYDKVDVVLKNDLSGKTPSADALRVSLEAAIASGRITTAATRITALLKATDNKDPELVFLGAQIAEQSGDQRMALVRYLAYARTVNDKTPKLDHALRYVLKREAYPEEYKKLVKTFGADDVAWQYGLALLNKLNEQLDASGLLDASQFVIESFGKDPTRVTQVHAVLRTAADGFVFGKEPKDRYVRPLRAVARAGGIPDQWYHVEHLFSQSDPGLSEVERYEVIKQYQDAAKAPLSPTLVYRFLYVRNLPTDDAKIAAGKHYLALEPLYAAAKDRLAFDYYCRVIGESPQAFQIKDKVLVTPADMQRRAGLIGQKFSVADGINLPLPATIQQHITYADNYAAATTSPTDPAARAAFLQANIAVITPGQVATIFQLTNGANAAGVAQQAIANRNFKESVEIRLHAINYFNQNKDKASLLAIARDYTSAYPGNFNQGYLQGPVFGSALMEFPEKLALLKELVAKCGFNPSTKAIVDGLATDKANWGDKPEFQALKAAFDAKPQATDPAARASSALANIAANPAAPDANVLPTAKALVDTLPAGFVGGEEKAKTAQELAAMQVLAQHSAHVWNNPDAVVALADLWLPKLSIQGTAWYTLVNRVREHQKYAALANYVPLYAAQCKALNTRGEEPVWRQLAYIPRAKDAAASPLAAAYPQMPTDLALEYAFAQRSLEGVKLPAVLAELTTIVTAPGAKLSSGYTAKQVLYFLGQYASPEAKPTPELIKPLWQAYLDDFAKGVAPEPIYEAFTFGAYQRSGQTDLAAQHLAAFLPVVQKRPVEQQLEFWNTIAQYSPLAIETSPEAQKGKTPPLTPGMRRHTIINTVVPLLAKVPERNRETTRFYAYQILDLHPFFVTPTAEQQKADPELVKQIPLATGAAKEVAKAVMAGTKFDGAGIWLVGPVNMLTREAIEAGNWPEATKLLAFYGSIIGQDGSWDGNYNQSVLPVFNLLTEKGAHEAAFAWITSIERNAIASLPENAPKQMQMLKGKAASQIAGLIPVPPEDATYDLYRAAHALELGDETKAWELTSPKVKVLVESWLNYEPRYVAWSVDQLRKQKMLKEALDFAFTVLLQEANLDPDVAARVSLAKGDVYRDMENFQAARIEYEALKNNPKFNKTEAGAQGVYRLVELHILTKDYVSAEQLLERMVDSDDLRTQAEANYLYARMVFQQGEYKQAKQYLKRVRERVLNHVGAALLEGELNLLLPGGLQNTEVAIGDPRLATVVIPGRSLEMKLQDQNLSVARGGASIPVVIRTSKGNDVERAELLPSGSDKNLFAGRIATVLGKAQPNNVTLELVGDDVVSYEIDPAFQKANDINYPAKKLEVRADARLAASSGEILSEEEQEKRELERQAQQRRSPSGPGSRKSDVSRDGATVRPGSKIFVQVTDFDRDLTDAPDTVRVNLHTTSGDAIELFPLAETGPHTGVFRAAVPTGIPLPKAQVSDAEEGSDPAVVIREAASGMWSSLADAKKGKWVEVDTMSSHAVASAWIEVPDPSQLKDVTVSGLLADDFTDLASLPARDEAASKGGVVVEFAADQYGSTAENFRRVIKLGTTQTFTQAAPDYSRASTALKGKDGWATVRVRGMFYLPQNQPLELKFLNKPSPHSWQIAYVLVDGEQVLGNTLTDATVQNTGKIDLARGVHTFEMLVRDHWGESAASVGYRKPDGTFAPLPAEWFDVAKNKPLAEALRPKGKVAVQGNRLVATLDKPMRLRKIRWTFNDFTGTAVRVAKLGVVDTKKRQIIPAKGDFSSATKDAVLQIAPGDQITIGYDDTRRLREDGSGSMTATLNSSYHNGTILLAEESIATDPNNPQHRYTTYLDAKRCRPGDQLMIVVTDYDEDETEQRDTVDVEIETSAGEKLVVKALETWPNYNVPEYNAHAGVFLAILKTGDATGKDTIKLSPGDKITATFVDRENTSPGIPIERAYSLFEAGKKPPAMLAYRTNVKMVPDDSPEAKAKLKRIAGKERKDAVLYKPLIVARHPEYASSVASAEKKAASAAKTVPAVASVGAPLLFEVNYPRAALNAGSVLEVTAVAESEIAAAKKANRQPTILKVPTHVEGVERLAQIKGYPIQLETNTRRDARDMLRDGTFAGVIRLQIGSPGDAVDDLVVGGVQEFAVDQRTGDRQGFYYRVPTLLVAGSDTVRITLKDPETGATAEQHIRLLSDARLEILDRTYTIESDAIHLGDRFQVRITDPDHDRSDERDVVTVTARAKSGDSVAMRLTETLPHSGIFTAGLQPRFIKQQPTTAPSATAPAEESLGVDFGDEVTFTYEDDMSIESAGTVAVTKRAKILHGADAKVATFTKRFKDPEIAVKTRFLMAESLFEMAKEHRKLNQKEQASEEIGRGKRILEEAIRDYPDTSLAVQGEYLLANLAQELGDYQEAIGRYSNVISTWPDSEYAAPSQFKKALCFERLENFDQAMEEYVKLTYVYPEDGLVADATVRLGNYYYKKQSFKIASKIFYNFQQKNPQHRLAAEALFLSAQCEYKQSDFPAAVKRFAQVVDTYPDEKEVRAEAMYWQADSLYKAQDAVKAYQTFKTLTWNYPDSKWAKIARGRLTEEQFVKMQDTQ